MPDTTTNGRRCQARRADGKRCRAWAVRGSHEALCQAHGGRKPAPEQAHSVYGSIFTAEESQEVAHFTEDLSLEDEIVLNRVLLRRLVRYIDDGGELTPDQLATLSGRVFRGTRIVSDQMLKLLALREKEKGQGDDRIPPWMAHALDALGEKWNLDL